MIQAPKFERFKKYFSRNKQSSIQEVVREPTAGGIVFRRGPKDNKLEILLIQDAKDRWTIPKGHIEAGETAKQTAEREIREETGLQEMQVLNWLGKIHFRYRRQTSLVLMTTQIYLVYSPGNTQTLSKESWMNDINWFDVQEALDLIEYEDIGKLMLLALRRIRHAGL
ncbi:MAG TPA: NUDIX domain-containing protein [Patescibacteria group bacterium]|jgi:ADP-ribose pyrophosphatase YjhB (NUDIX family)|nr:NUDIX domain-containing protein [Patescibacteria group bacterium]